MTMIGVQIDQALTDRMVGEAITESAQAHFAGDERRVRQALLRGQCEQCDRLSASLVRQISEYLGQVDSRVKAVYQYEPAEDRQPPPRDDAAAGHAGIHLVIWVERKSAALSALTETLKVSLAASLSALGCPVAEPDCYTPDLEIVDSTDVEQSRGFGLLVNAPHLHSHSVWSRSAETEPAPDREADIPSRVRFLLPESFDPELIPEARLLEHALSIERLGPEDRQGLEHHLTELKVTLIRRIISDQLRYINIAKHWFTTADLEAIYQHRIGFGRIGGKSAGMLLADRILSEVASEDLKAHIRVPESFFLGTDLMYIFMAMNGLMHWNEQKYKSEEQMRADYPQIREDFSKGDFPPEILVELRAMLDAIGPRPIIARSSSQLEDNLGTSFAGKYDSHFCANQAGAEENLRALTQAIASTYASTFKPEALLYRQSRGLQDYDERMSVLIQGVEGERFGQYYFPLGAGVAFSRNLYRWAPQIRREDGFVRLVWGLGTRAVERVGNDYPRMVALSHPALQPDDSPEAIRSYSQHYVDVIDLTDNSFKSLPLGDVLTPRYPQIRFLVQLEQDGYFITPQSRVMQADLPRLAVTFDSLLRRTRFAALMSETLRLLEQHYQTPVDVEFTLSVPDPFAAPPDARISLLQCRPQSSLKATGQGKLPEGLPERDIIFSSHFMVPQGYLSDIRYVIFVPPEAYLSLPTDSARNEVGRLIARLNKALPEKSFICVGPGRWGTTNADLGVFVAYSDICHAGALVELSGRAIGTGPEPSLGTHFFQDLMEAQIYPVALPLDDPDTLFNQAFFYKTPNALQRILDAGSKPSEALRLIEVSSSRPGHHLTLVMDDEEGKALAYVAADEVGRSPETTPALQDGLP
jgi:hypothetical protein